MDLGGRGMVYCRGYDNYTYRRLQSVETPSMRTNGGGGAVLVAARSWSVFQSFLVVCCVLLLSPPIHVGLFVVWFMRCVTFDTRPIWGLRPQKLCQICGGAMYIVPYLHPVCQPLVGPMPRLALRI